MAIKTIVTGGAHSAYGNEQKGDQRQKGVPDYTGEVSLRALNEAKFKTTYSAYSIYRLINAGQAADAADLMIRACNNAKIGYGQPTRNGIFEHGVDSTELINCDCSSIVSYCLSKATSANINATTSTLANAMNKTGLFMKPFAVSTIDFETNPPCNGDVLLKSGHTEMVVSGNPRIGNDNEITTGTWVGDGDAVSQYTNDYHVTYPFEARTVAPSKDNPWYQQDYGMTENGKYAWGRFSEILHAWSNISRGIPRKWYVYTEDRYSRGTTPALGAIMCYTNINDLNDAGIACVVEAIDKKSIHISWKNHNTNTFEYLPLSENSDGTWDLDLDKDGIREYKFQGFIYNPTVEDDTIKFSSGDFVENAKAAIGNQGSIILEYTDLIPKRDSWSAGFIVAIAKQTGNDLLGNIIPDTYSCSSIGKIGVMQGMGTWLDGPALGGDPLPRLGDIILIRTHDLKRKNNSKYDADKAGIVISVKGSNKSKTGKNQTSSMDIEVAMGDIADQVKKISFATNSAQISGYFRPNWDKKDGYKGEVRKQLDQYDQYGLYTEGTSLEDAAMRELRYVTIGSDGLKPSIKSSGITLSAINYTGMLANFYTAFVESGTAPGYSIDGMVNNWTVKTGEYMYDGESSGSNLNIYVGDVPAGAGSIEVKYPHGNKIQTATLTVTPTVTTIYKTLSQYLGNPAGAIGILGNIYAESRCDPTAGKGRSKGPCGLCQWLGGRLPNMISYCGTDWYNNLSGQLGFINQELNGSYKKVRDVCMTVPNTLQGAFTAADTFVRRYEAPGNYEWEVPARQAFAEGYWKLIRGNT